MILIEFAVIKPDHHSESQQSIDLCIETVTRACGCLNYHEFIVVVIFFM